MGLGTAPDACVLWGVSGCGSLGAVDKSLAARARALAHAVAAVSAARLAASVGADTGWCLAALAALNQVLSVCQCPYHHKTWFRTRHRAPLRHRHAWNRELKGVEASFMILISGGCMCRPSSGWRLPASEAWASCHVGEAQFALSSAWCSRKFTEATVPGPVESLL